MSDRARSVTVGRWVAGAFVAATVGIGATYIASAANSPSTYETPVTWTNVFGTAGDDSGGSIARSSAGDLYVTGSTDGAFPGFTNQGDTDVYVTKFDKNGRRIWARQFGTTEYDSGYAIAVSSSGDVYVAGSTYGHLSGGGPALSVGDGFVARFDKNGNQKWVRQFGSVGADITTGVATAGSNDIYVVGRTSGDLDGGGAPAELDAFITRYDKNGNQKWVHQFGDGRTSAEGVAARGSEIYVAGSTEGNLGSAGGPFPVGGADGFLRRLDTDGSQRWTRQLGSATEDQFAAITVVGKNDVYVAGHTAGEVVPGGHLGGNDGLVARYDKDGNFVWARQVGTTMSDDVTAVKATTTGVYLVGTTSGDIDGAGPAVAVGTGDLYVMQLATHGAPVSSRQLGTPGDDRTPGIVLTSTGHPVVTGATREVIFGHPALGGVDVVIAQLP